MEVLSTAKASKMLGLKNVQHFHRLVAKCGIRPFLRAEGQTGAMFWTSSDVERIRQEIDAERQAS